MSIKTLMAAACGAFLAVAAMSALAEETKTEDGKKSCCTSADGKESCCTSACEQASGKMRCSLTGKTMDTCCCVRKEGKLHCRLADKDVETCCCKPADESDKIDDEQTEDAPTRDGERL
jgi:hypothetical protein